MNTVLHFTHHKCGTRWVASIFHEVATYLGASYGEFDQHARNSTTLGKFSAPGSHNIVTVPNVCLEDISSLDSFRAVHVIRDPRDLLVSSYFSSLKTHSDTRWPELTAHRERLQAASPEEGLLLEMEFISDVFESLSGWNYADDRVLEIKMEDLMQNNYTGFLRGFRFLGLMNEEDASTSSISVQLQNTLRTLWSRVRSKASLPGMYQQIPVSYLLGIIHRNRFEAKAGGRSQGTEDQGSHYRKGVSGDWVNHFTPEVEAAFKEQHGELLLNLGYEASSDWTAADVGDARR